jgi:hypothetical protein
VGVQCHGIDFDDNRHERRIAVCISTMIETTRAMAPGSDNTAPRRRLRRTVAACLVAFAAAAGAGGLPAANRVGPAPRPAHDAAPWPAPSDPLRRAVAAGLKPGRHESLVHHVHAHLDVFVNGRPVTVPAGIGIDIHDSAVHVFDLPDGTKAYGGIAQCPRACISPLHTHDDTGILHTESTSPAPNLLGQFFTEWGVRLDRSCVGGYCRPAAAIAVFVDGRRYRGDPRAIRLTNHEEIAIVIGTPPAKIPSTADFSKA